MNKKILVIDDSPTLRKLLRFYLKKKGYEVHEAHNGRVGLEAIGKEVFDFIILDMDMPVMNGAQVLEKLTQMVDFNVPVLILSADKAQESKATGMSLGASYYITKPFKPLEVVSRIEEIFEERDSKK
jgi:DNA-binding response OmpR family regulator